MTQQPLTRYRVLDLTEGGYNWCGKVLADLGADVIKVEPPGGSPTRERGPFVNDEPNPERSLYWYAYCVNKRGITLDLESKRLPWAAALKKQFGVDPLIDNSGHPMRWSGRVVPQK